jgi:hypothetical protein
MPIVAQSVKTAMSCIALEVLAAGAESEIKELAHAVMKLIP